MRLRLLTAALLLLAGTAYAQPALPQLWVDNNRALDGVNCGGFCSGTGYVAPTYEYELGSSSWLNGPPPGCSFSLPYALTGAGKQAAVAAIEACRTATGAGTILDVPPGVYSLANGIVIPQTNSALATQFNVIRSTMWTTLAAMPEPVCAGGIQDNVPDSTAPGLLNPECDGVNAAGLSEPCPSGGALAYQLTASVFCIPAGSFTLANGTATDTSAYDYVQYMYQDVCTNNTCTPFQLCSPITGSSNPCTGGTSVTCPAGCGPDHWLFEDGVATRTAGTTGQSYLTTAGDSPASATALTQYAFAIDFRRYWAHGDWTTLAAGRNSIINAFFIPTCQQCSIVGSQVSMVMRPGAEGHTVGAGQVGPGTKIDNDWLEGQSSCIFTGGQAGATGPGITPIGSFVPAQDMQIGRVRCTFPRWWLNGSLAGNAYWTGSSIVRKNCQEMKEAIRAVFYGFICENTDNSGGQSGISGTLNVRQSSSGTIGQNYQAVIQHVTIQGAIFRNTCEGFSIGARSSGAGNGGGVSQPMSNVAMTDVLHYNVTGLNPGCVDSHGTPLDRGIRIVSSDQHWYGTVTQTDATHATFVATASIDGGGSFCNTASTVGCAPMGELDAITSTSLSGLTMTVSANNTLVAGEDVLALGLTTQTCLNGQDLTALTASPTSFTTTVTAGMGCALGTHTDTGTVQGPLGYQVLGIPAGLPAPVWGCTNTAFNNVPTYTKGGFTTPSAIAPLVTTGSTAWDGASTPGNYTVTYLWPAGGGNPIGSSDSGGTCQLTNTEGIPANLYITHTTYISDTTNPIGADGTVSGGPEFYMNGLFRDSIMLTGASVPANKGGWFNSAVGPSSEGTATGGTTGTTQWNTDISTLSVNHLVWPGRPASAYTEYGNNLSYPDFPWGCTGAGCHPPITMFYPATSNCTGAVPSSACVGFVGAMSTLTMPLALQDYHQYALRSDSVFHNAASDGTDMGARTSVIDAFQTMNLYGCNAPCGSPGPFPDSAVAQLPPPTAPAAKAFAALDRPGIEQGGSK